MDIIRYNDLKKYTLDFKYSNISNKSNITCYLSENNNEYPILIKTPKSELQSTIQSGFLVISFINTDKNTIFLNFIKKIEKEANLYIKNKLKKKAIKLHSGFIYEKKLNSIKDLENVTKYIFNISKYSNSFKIFDYENNSIDKKQLDIYSNVVLLIKLQNIWIDLDNKSFGLNWNIFQIKNYSEINLSNCLIFDSDDDNDVDIIKKEVIVQKCVFCSSTCTFNNNINNINIAKGGKGIVKGGKGKGKGYITNNSTYSSNTSNTTNTSGRGEKKPEKKKEELPGMFLPSVNELLDMKSKLKKMVKINSDDD